MQEDPQRAAGRPIGILVKTFPKVSETFILGELAALRRQGIPFRILSLNPASEQVAHPSVQDLASQVDYVTSASMVRTGIDMFTSHIDLLFCRPVAYFKTLFTAVRTREPHPFTHFSLACRIAWIVERRGLCHLHTHYISQPTAISELVKALTGTGYSVSAHAKDIYLSSPDELQRKIRGAAFTVTCTDYNRKHLQEIASVKGHVALMYHGIDTERFQPDRGIATDPVRLPLILSVGRLREKKGFPVLISACKALHASDINFRCQIVGYGPEQDRLQKMIHECGLQDSVRLLGKLTNTEVIDRYREAAVFVLPCQIASDGDRDGIPNVLLEAMAMELPVVSTRVSGIPEVVKDTKNGLLVPPTDVVQLTEALRKILTDRQLARDLGSAARKTVIEMFSAEANICQLCDLLTAATSNCSSNSAEPTLMPEKGCVIR